MTRKIILIVILKLNNIKPTITEFFNKIGLRKSKIFFALEITLEVLTGFV